MVAFTGRVWLMVSGTDPLLWSGGCQCLDLPKEEDRG